MAKVWKKLQRADGDFTGTIDGTAAGTIKTGAAAGSTAKVVTDAAFDASNVLKVSNANSALVNANTTKGDVGLGNVDNDSTATILGGNLTGTIGGTAVATVKSGAAAGATANQDSTSTILGGNLTGTIAGTAVATVKSGAASGATANQDSTSTILGGNLTGTIAGTAVATVKSGAASGATANQDSTSTILGGNLTGSVNSVAVGTVTTGAAAGTTAKGITDDAFDTSGSDPVLNVANAAAGLKNSGITISSGGVLSGAGGGTVTPTGIGAVDTDLSNAPNTIKNAQISISSAGVLSGAGGGTVSATGLGAIKTDLANAPSTIVNSNTTKNDVGLGAVINQAVTVASGKIKLDGTAQTLDADTVGGDSKDTIKSAAVSTAETNIIGSAPGTLNTLDELAAALNDDASFNSTITTSIASKAVKPVTISNPSSTPTEDVGTQGIHNDELYVVQDV